MRQLSSITLLLALLIGCSSFAVKRFQVNQVNGDLIVREIGVNNALTSAGGTDVAASTDGSVVQSIPRIDFALSGEGLFATHNVIIKSVSGSIIFERALCDQQNVDIPGSLGKLFVPGDPFAAAND